MKFHMYQDYHILTFDLPLFTLSCLGDLDHLGPVEKIQFQPSPLAGLGFRLQ